MLIIKKLNKIYDQTKERPFSVLQDINLSFNSKGFYTILGKSGSGKSTLLHLLAALGTYTSGSITYQGFELKQFTEEEKSSYLKEHVALIFQDFNLIERMTVFENMQLACELSHPTLHFNDMKLKITSALAEVGLSDFITKDTNTLSGGEKQRLAITRALVKDAKIILADEPTGNLDSVNAKVILDLLKKVSVNHLVIMVTHDESYAENYSDYIIRLFDGKTDTVLPSEIEVHEKITVKKDKTWALSFRFALNYIMSEKRRLIMTMMVFLISLSFIIFASLYLNYDVTEATLRTFESEHIQDIDFVKGLSDQLGSFTSTELDQLSNMFDESSFYLSYRMRSADSFSDPLIILGYPTENSPQNTLSVYKVIIMSDGSNFLMIEGASDFSYGKVLITDYLADQLISYHQNLDDMSDLIGYSLYDESHIPLIVSGIIQTDYKDMMAQYEHHEINLNTFLRLQREVYTNLYMSHATYRDALSVMSRVPLAAVDGIQMDVMFASNQITTTQSIIGSLPVEDDEILVSLNSVDQYISKDLLPSYLNNHLDEILPLIGTSIEIQYKDPSLGTKTYIVSGIINDFDDHAGYSLMVTQDEYNRLVYDNPGSLKERSLFVKIAESERDDFIIYATNQGYIHKTMYSSQLYALGEGIGVSSVIIMSLSFVLIFIGALLMYAFMSVHLFSHQKEIGILLSLGMRKMQLREIYTLIWGILLFISFILSIGIGYVIIYLLNQSLRDYWSILIKVFYMSGQTILYALIASIIYLVIATLLSLRKVMALEPINIIKGIQPSK
jgi:ABC-type lipoprotein export system ATPase subunit